MFILSNKNGLFNFKEPIYLLVFFCFYSGFVAIMGLSKHQSITPNTTKHIPEIGLVRIMYMNKIIKQKEIIISIEMIENNGIKFFIYCSFKCLTIYLY